MHCAENLVRYLWKILKLGYQIFVHNWQNKFKETADADKVWFANYCKGSEAGPPGQKVSKRMRRASSCKPAWSEAEPRLNRMTNSPVRQQERPLQLDAKARSRFGCGDLTCRIHVWSTILRHFILTSCLHIDLEEVHPITPTYHGFIPLDPQTSLQRLLCCLRGWWWESTEQTAFQKISSRRLSNVFHECTI